MVIVILLFADRSATRTVVFPETVNCGRTAIRTLNPLPPKLMKSPTAQ